MLDFALERGLELRFIETMTVGTAGAGNMVHHYPAARILEHDCEHYGSRLVPMQGRRGPGPARYYQVGDSAMKVGVISAVSRNFCKTCNRVRLTARGDLVLCLGHEDRVSLRSALYNGRSDDEIKQDILAAIARKPERHFFNSDAEHRGTTQMVTAGWIILGSKPGSGCPGRSLNEPEGYPAVRPVCQVTALMCLFIFYA